MEQDIELTTVNGFKVVIKGYISRGANNAYQEVLMAGMNLGDVSDGEFDKDKVPMVAAMNGLNALVERLVQSVNGATTDIKAKLDDMPEDDYAEVQEKVQEVQGRSTLKAQPQISSDNSPQQEASTPTTQD
jgi:hypothetical protein